MAVIGIGTDIVEIARIKTVLERQEKFAERILTDFEYAEMRDSRAPERYLAKRFAAKEAALKALGTGLGQGISWHELEVQHTELGQPLLSFSGVARQHSDNLGVTHIHLSVSDEISYALAMVVLESR